jgi:hypothetical protein
MGKGRASRGPGTFNSDAVPQGAVTALWSFSRGPSWAPKCSEALAEPSLSAASPMTYQHCSGLLKGEGSDFLGPQVLRKLLWSVRGSGVSTGFGVRGLYYGLALAPDSCVTLTQSFKLSGSVTSAGNQEIGINHLSRSLPAGTDSRFHDSRKSGFWATRRAVTKSKHFYAIREARGHHSELIHRIYIHFQQHWFHKFSDHVD